MTVPSVPSSASNPARAGSGAIVAAPFPEGPVVPISPWGREQPPVDIVHGFVGSLPGILYNQALTGLGVNPVSTDRLWGAGLTLILVIAPRR